MNFGRIRAEQETSRKK